MIPPPPSATSALVLLWAGDDCYPSPADADGWIELCLLEC